MATKGQGNPFRSGGYNERKRSVDEYVNRHSKVICVASRSSPQGPLGRRRVHRGATGTAGKSDSRMPVSSTARREGREGGRRCGGGGFASPSIRRRSGRRPKAGDHPGNPGEWAANHSRGRQAGRHVRRPLARRRPGPRRGSGGRGGGRRAAPRAGDDEGGRGRAAGGNLRERPSRFRTARAPPRGGEATRTLSARCQRCPGPRSSAGTPRGCSASAKCAAGCAIPVPRAPDCRARIVSDNAGRDHDPADPGPGIAHGNRVGKIARALIEEGELIDRGGTGHRVYGPQDPPFATIRTGPPALMPISVSVIFHSVPPRPSRESGGTGRRARLRISWPTAVGVRVPPFALRPRSPRTIWDR